MGFVINNSTATITFPNGTCNSPIALDFNKNVMIENQGIALCTTTSKDIILKPHEQSRLPSTINSGIAYKAIAPGVTNATISFNYGVETASGKSPISDNISRVYTFNINNKPNAISSITHHHIKGVKLLQIHTNPLTVPLRGTFSMRALVFNNSSSTIIFPNGTCNSPIALDFNKNVVVNRTSLCAEAPQKVISLKPNERSFIALGVPYKAIAPGVTNATISFNYGVETASGKSPISDNISRVYTFNINNKTTAAVHTNLASHIRGIKVLQLHTNPSTVAIGNTFSIGAFVFNNSSSTISFSNGTCNHALRINFNKNVLENRPNLCTATAQKTISLRPAEHSFVVSDVAYKAMAPGKTNSTVVFNYGFQAANGKSVTVDSTSRTYVFNIHQYATRVATSNDTNHYHIKGIKVLHVHAARKVYVGSTISLRGTVVNNSTVTISFANGTCASPLSITFNKGVVVEPHATTTVCKVQRALLKPGEQSSILSPSLSGIAYRAKAPGMINATIFFKYEALTSTNKLPVNDNVSRTYSFHIYPTTTTAPIKTVTP
jgi:hypothetical protein